MARGNNDDKQDQLRNLAEYRRKHIGPDGRSTVRLTEEQIASSTRAAMRLAGASREQVEARLAAEQAQMPEQQKPGKPKDWFCLAYEIPKPVREQIHAWVQTLPWDEEAELQNPDKYHITAFWAPEGFGDPDQQQWARDNSGTSYHVRAAEVDTFSGFDDDQLQPIVLRFDAPELSQDAQKLIGDAEKRGLKPARFDSYKPHITIGHNPTAMHLPALELTFDTEPLCELHSYYDQLKSS